MVYNTSTILVVNLGLITNLLSGKFFYMINKEPGGALSANHQFKVLL